MQLDDSELRLCVGDYDGDFDPDLWPACEDVCPTSTFEHFLWFLPNLVWIYAFNGTLIRVLLNFRKLIILISLQTRLTLEKLCSSRGNPITRAKFIDLST
jgi:hypothetical protein